MKKKENQDIREGWNYTARHVCVMFLLCSFKPFTALGSGFVCDNRDITEVY